MYTNINVYILHIYVCVCVNDYICLYKCFFILRFRNNKTNISKAADCQNINLRLFLGACEHTLNLRVIMTWHAMPMIYFRRQKLNRLTLGFFNIRKNL
jgi:hypothetical protein